MTNNDKFTSVIEPLINDQKIKVIHHINASMDDDSFSLLMRFFAADIESFPKNNDGYHQKDLEKEIASHRPVGCYFKMKSN